MGLVEVVGEGEWVDGEGKLVREEEMSLAQSEQWSFSAEPKRAGRGIVEVLLVLPVCTMCEQNQMMLGAPLVPRRGTGEDAAW